MPILCNLIKGNIKIFFLNKDNKIIHFRSKLHSFQKDKKVLICAVNQWSLLMKNKTFEEGEYVVYPAHGVGIIKGIEHQNIAGVQLDVIIISFDKDKMMIKLPLNASTKSKIRKLCSKEEMQEAIKCLSTPSRTKKMIWSRRAQEYETKINSGIPASIAEVVRDLHRSATQAEHSYSERQIYQEALDRLIKEYAAVANIDEKEAMQYLEKILSAA